MNLGGNPRWVPLMSHYSLLTTEIKRPLNCDKSRIETHQSHLESSQLIAALQLN